MRQLSNVNADGYKQRNLKRECCWLLAATEEWKTRQRTGTHKSSGESIVKYTKLATRNQYPPEEKIKIVLDALYGEDNIAELYCSEGISQRHLLQTVERLHGGWEVAVSWRYCPS